MKRGAPMTNMNQRQTLPSSTVKPYGHDQRAAVNALAATLRLRDNETQGHSERVVQFSRILGRELGLDQAQMQSLE